MEMQELRNGTLHKRTKENNELLREFMKVERCNGSHTMTMVMNPVSLTKDGPNMKAREEMRAPEDEHNLIIRSYRTQSLSAEC